MLYSLPFCAYDSVFFLPNLHILKSIIRKSLVSTLIWFRFFLVALLEMPTHATIYAQDINSEVVQQILMYVCIGPFFQNAKHIIRSKIANASCFINILSIISLELHRK